MSLLLDTCAAIWLLKDDGLNSSSIAAIDAETQAGRDVFLSPSTGWELGVLMARGRIAFASDIIHRIEELQGLAFTEQTPRALYDSNFLPGSPPNDPTDRIIIATAREQGMQIVTRDREILAYAAQGHVKAMAC